MSSGALLALSACALLAAMSRAQDTDTHWFWLMADSKNSTPVCPGRCLAVNVSTTGDAYANKQVGFMPCKTLDTSTSTTDVDVSSVSNNNQQWLHDPVLNEIQINATDSTDNTGEILCLQPDPANANKTLTVTPCSGRKHQKWIVANNTVATLAFDPPRYVAMSYRLAGFLNPTDGTTAWREAWIIPAKARNSSITTTFSMVDGTQELNLSPPRDNEPPESRNFIRNGGFEISSSDFSAMMTNLSLSQSGDIFGLCEWEIRKTGANLQGGTNPPAAEGNRSLYLNDGLVKQTVATSPGAFYALVFKVHVATPSRGDSTSASSDNCKGSDTLSVNPFPSTNVHITVDVGNGSWATKHVSFQSLGRSLELSFKGCATCGCFVDDVNFMQVIDRAPFPPPPPLPSPPPRPGQKPSLPDEDHPPPGLFGRFSSKRLSNWAVAGLVVGTAALFFVIGAAFFGVACVKEKKQRETELSRPREWSISTTPVQSERGRRSHPDSYNAPTTPSAAPQPASPRTSSTGGATKYSTSQSSANPQSGSGL